MLKVSLLEFLVRGIPEGFLFIFAGYTFSKTAVNLKRYLFSSAIFAIVAYMIRWLPILVGVHTILTLIMLIILSVWVGKIDIIKSIRAGITTFIVAFICEGVNLLLIQYILHKDIDKIFKDSVLKILYGIPSLIIFALVIALFYIRLSKRKELNCISYGEVSQ